MASGCHKKEKSFTCLKSFEDKRGMVIFYCFLISILTLMICSKSSFLYPMNDWSDINVYMTMGKGLLHGKVIYIDLIDHKGPYMYFIAALAYLISPGRFWGYFLLEVISMTGYLFYSWKTIRLYVERDVCWILPCFAVAIAASKSFFHGGSTEELCLGAFAYAIYSLLALIKKTEGDKPNILPFILNGLFCGLIFWTKFTLVGIYIVWIVAAFVHYVSRKEIKKALIGSTLFLGTMALTTVPCLIYFMYHDACWAWKDTYIMGNIFSYSSEQKTSILSNLVIAVKNAFIAILKKRNLQYSIPTILGILSFSLLPDKKNSVKERLVVIMMFMGMALGTFYGGVTHDYYSLPLSVFVMFSGVWICKTVNKFIIRKPWKSVCVGIGNMSMVIVCVVMAFVLSQNTYLMRVSKEDMPQYRFKKTIDAAKNNSLLNYGFLDGGFYTVCNQIPNVRYFCRLNKDADKVMDEQNQYLREGKTEFVITWNAEVLDEETIKTWPIVSENYELVDYMYFYYESDYRTYALFKKY